MFELVERLIQNSEVLELATVPQTRSMIDWVATNILEKNILTVENWLEIGFHLCKQRWNDSLDWLELQPMSKIQTMIEVVKNHVEDVESAQKKKLVECHHSGVATLFEQFADKNFIIKLFENPKCWIFQYPF